MRNSTVIFMMLLTILIVAVFALINCKKSHVSMCEDCNVILISIDTLRADHLGIYGYFRDTSPNLDNLANQGIYFTNVYSQASWTLPSHATLFTSLYPSQHEMVTFDSPSLNDSIITLAEVMKQNNYKTAAFVDHFDVGSHFGLNHGFDYFDEKGASEGLEKHKPNLLVYSGIKKINERAEKWIDENKDGKFFIFLHYYDVHAPYISPEPYITLFDPNYHGNLSTYGYMEDGIQDQIKNQDDLNHVIAQYDGGIRYVDSEIGTFWHFLQNESLTKKTMIIIVSDHGEEFMEHERIGHGVYLYKNVIHVPVIFSFPTAYHKVINSTLGLIDVPTTILEALRIESPQQFEGIDMLTGNRSFAYSEFEDYTPFSFSAINNTFQLIISWDTNNFTKEAYNLTTDAKENSNIAQQFNNTLFEVIMNNTLWSLNVPNSPTIKNINTTFIGYP